MGFVTKKMSEFFWTLFFFQIFLSGLLNQVEEITLQATSNRRVVKRLTRSVSVDDHGRAKVNFR